MVVLRKPHTGKHNESHGVTPRPRRGRLNRTSVVLLAVAMLVLAVSAGATMAATGSGASAKSAAAKGSPISIFQIADSTGPTAFPVLAATETSIVKAWNATGGIAGHPIKLTVCNGQGTPNAAQACARNAVSAKVAAVVGSFSLGEGAALPVLTAGKIPYIPADAFNPIEFTAKNSFPIVNAQTPVGGEGFIAGKKCSSSVIVEPELPTNAVTEAAVNAELKAAGKPAAKVVKVPLVVGDYSVQASQVAHSGAACVLAAMNSTAALSFYPALKSAGSKQRIVGIGGTSVTPEIIGKLGSYLNGTLIADYYPSYQSKPWSAYRTAVGKYGNAKKYDYTSTLAEGSWVALSLFKQAAQQVLASRKTVSAATIQAALASTKVFTAGGLTPNLNFSKPSGIKGQPRMVNTSVWLEKVVNGRIVDADTKFHSVASAFQAGR